MFRLNDYLNIINKFLKKEEISILPFEDLISSLDISKKHKEVLLKIAQIPYGKMISYSEFAKISGFENQTRSIATLIGKNPIPIIVPCHRIIMKNGQYGNYIFGVDIKKELIEFEKGNLNSINKKTIEIVENFFKIKKYD